MAAPGPVRESPQGYGDVSESVKPAVRFAQHDGA